MLRFLDGYVTWMGLVLLNILLYNMIKKKLFKIGKYAV